MFVLSVSLYLSIIVKCIINARIDERSLFKDPFVYVTPPPISQISNKHPLSIKGLFLINIIIQPKNLKPRAFTKASTLNVIKFSLHNIDMLQNIKENDTEKYFIASIISKF